jgi:lysine biosynthesis protein LysW
LSAEIQSTAGVGDSAGAGRACLPSTGNLEEGTVPVGTCPDCEAEVHVDLDADKGDAVTCDECATKLEIVGLDPVELDIAEEDGEEDLDEDDEDEY